MNRILTLAAAGAAALTMPAAAAASGGPSTPPAATAAARYTYGDNNCFWTIAYPYTYWGDPVPGDAGSRWRHRDTVGAIQQALNRYGYGLTVDGIFGGRTDAAVRAFQRRKGLAVDGKVGQYTTAKLGIGWMCQ